MYKISRIIIIYFLCVTCAEVYVFAETRSAPAVLPSAGVLAEGGMFRSNPLRYSGQTRRSVNPDLFSYNNFVLSLKVQENLFYHGERAGTAAPYRITYNVSFADLRYEFKPGSLSFFWDHSCNNIINQNNTEDLQPGWYRFGVMWETPGNRIGKKDLRVNTRGEAFEFLGNIDYMAAAGKNQHSQFGFYNEIVNGSMRVDIARLYFFVPYAEGTGMVIFDGDKRFDYSAEAGVRAVLKECDITPFVRYSHKHDADTYRGKTVNFTLFGIRAETLFDSGMNAASLDGKDNDPLSKNILPPRIHFQAGYGRCFFSSYLNYSADTSIRISLLTFPGVVPVTPYIESGLTHYSLEADRWPRYLSFKAEPGLSFEFKSIVDSADMFYSRVRRDEGNEFKGYAEVRDAAGVRLSTAGMKTENGTVAHGRAGLIISSSYIFHRVHYDFLSESTAKGRWNIASFDYFGLYASQSVSLYERKSSPSKFRYETESEGGVPIPDSMNMDVYIRYGRKINLTSMESKKENIYMVGMNFGI